MGRTTHTTSPLHPKAGMRTVSAAKPAVTPRPTKGSDLLGVGMATQAGAALRNRKKRLDEGIG